MVKTNCLNSAALGFGLSIALLACSTDFVEDSVDSPDAGPPIEYVSAAGTYQLRSTWTITGPISEEHSIGDVVADLLIDQIVGAVPSVLQDEARGVVEDALGDLIAEQVDANAPPELKSGSDLFTALTRTLASIEVESSLVLDSNLDGTETISKFTFSDDTELAGMNLTADWNGTRAGAAGLNIEDHQFGIRFGEFVEEILVDVLGKSNVATITEEAAAAVACQPLVGAITGTNANYEIELAGGQSVSVSAQTITDACASIRLAMGTKVLGIFDKDAPIILGGSVTLLDPDRDLVANSIGGTLSGRVDMGPPALAPLITSVVRADK